MRYIKQLTTIALLVISMISQAQTGTGRIKGTVTDGSAKILESATITLLRASDSSVAKIHFPDRNRRV